MIIQEGMPSTIEINLAAVEGGTIVSLREYGCADTPSARSAMLSCAAGWGEDLTLMKFYMEYGVVY